jgi:hypothetical protein
MACASSRASTSSIISVCAGPRRCPARSLCANQAQQRALQRPDRVHWTEGGRHPVATIVPTRAAPREPHPLFPALPEEAPVPPVPYQNVADDPHREERVHQPKGRRPPVATIVQTRTAPRKPGFLLQALPHESPIVPPVANPPRSHIVAPKGKVQIKRKQGCYGPGHPIPMSSWSIRPGDNTRDIALHLRPRGGELCGMQIHGRSEYMALQRIDDAAIF